MGTAYVSPGQGSQSIGMASALITHSKVLSFFKDVNDIVGYDLLDLIQNGTLEILTQTRHAQPAIVAVSLAQWMMMTEESDLHPSFFLGHSLGEYAALSAAGGLDPLSAVKLVFHRALAMHEATQEHDGAMAAILHFSKDALKMCLPEDQSFVLANDNGQQQLVISGLRESVLACIEKAQAQGARRCVMLPVSGAFHSPFMKSAEMIMRPLIMNASITDPNVALIPNVLALPTTDSITIKEALIQQICGTVRFYESVLYAHQQDVQQFIEVGPGKVLTNMIQRFF